MSSRERKPRDRLEREIERYQAKVERLEYENQRLRNRVEDLEADRNV